MAAIPQPRTPTCLRHTVWIASCPDCRAAHAPAAIDRSIDLLLDELNGASP